VIAQKIFLIIVFFSIIFLIVLEKYIFGLKNKKQLHRFFMYTILFLIIYNIGVTAVVSSNVISNYKDIRFEYIVFFGITFCSLFFLLTGLVFVKQTIKFNYKYLALFIIPTITNIILWTNQYHRLFYKEYSTASEYSFGPYFYISMVFTWLYILIGISYLISFSIKNSGFFSKQTKLLVLGTIIPLPFNISWILGSILHIQILKFYSYYDISPITLTVTVSCYALAIFKFDFLNVVPIALQKIVDLISDSYIVINENFEIIDFNQTLINTFSSVMMIKRKENLFELISASEIQMNIKRMEENALFAKEQKTNIAYEEHLVGNKFNKYFDIEITPIYSGQNFLGSIILFKDISEHKKNIEIIKRNQEVLMEQERMASLGQMIGGIAHNLKTPIMSLAGGIEALKDLANEYRDSIEDRDVNNKDHYEIADEMLEWLEKMKPYCSYMSDIIGAVKGQAVQMNYSSSEKFTLSELIKRIEVLMNHQLKRFHCTLKTSFNIDLNTEIKGEITNLVQVIDNIIINAIESYEGKSGTIDFEITKDENFVKFLLRDYGKGIPQDVKNRLFKEMLTTKGKNGTGLGLYMSYSTIKGRFQGNMEFVSKENVGTTFMITIPYINSVNRGYRNETVN